MSIGAYKYKIVMLGEFAVGKTSLVKRFVHNVFDDLYLTTIGVRVMKKDLVISGPPDARVTLLLWDIGGLQDFEALMPQYLQGASGAIIVADLTRVKTITLLEWYAEQFRRTNPDSAIAVAFNKDDMFHYEKASAEVKGLVESCGQQYGDAVFRTSAKTGLNVEKLFGWLAGVIRGGRS